MRPPPPPSLPLPPPENEDDYDSAADSDFDASSSASSGDESVAADGGADVRQKGKNGSKDKDGDVEMGSGDEGIVAQGRKKRTKGKGKGKGKEGEEEEGAVGVRVRLRSGRGGEGTKARTLPKASGATIDIDSVWARLNDPNSHTSPSQRPDSSSDPENKPPSTSDPALKDLPSILKAPVAEQTITIPHTYTFAGETHTSTKTVPTSSPEALAYLATKDKPSAPTTGPTLRRPLARKNLLNPNPTYLIRGRELPPRADLPTTIGGKGTRHLDTNEVSTRWDMGRGDRKGAKKLNTVEKSKLDWEKEVERKGMREELERAEKSGGSYLGRREFLERVEGKGEEGARVARLKVAGVGG